jgi:hypothetical protein
VPSGSHASRREVCAYDVNSAEVRVIYAHWREAIPDAEDIGPLEPPTFPVVRDIVVVGVRGAESKVAPLPRFPHGSTSYYQPTTTGSARIVYTPILMAELREPPHDLRLDSRTAPPCAEDPP